MTLTEHMQGDCRLPSSSLAQIIATPRLLIFCSLLGSARPVDCLCRYLGRRAVPPLKISLGLYRAGASTWRRRPMLAALWAQSAARASRAVSRPLPCTRPSSTPPCIESLAKRVGKRAGGDCRASPHRQSYQSTIGTNHERALESSSGATDWTAVALAAGTALRHELGGLRTGGCCAAMRKSASPPPRRTSPHARVQGMRTLHPPTFLKNRELRGAEAPADAEVERPWMLGFGIEASASAHSDGGEDYAPVEVRKREEVR
jgi:hypothetical protein